MMLIRDAHGAEEREASSEEVPTILCVEDDPAILELEQLIFKSRGYEVLTAGDGSEALSILRREIPDVIVLDVMMPGIDGYDLAQLLREDPCYCHLPIVFVSARRQAADFRRGFNSGALVYLSKPFTSRSLLTAVDSLLGMKSDGRRGPLSFVHAEASYLDGAPG